MLERLQSPLSRTHELPPEGGQHGHGMEVVDDGSSLMLCSPLIPQRDSLVEIADTEYISLDEASERAVENHRSPLHQVHVVDDIDEEDNGEREDEMRQTSAYREESSQTVKGDAADNDASVNDGESQPSDPSGTRSRGIFRWPWSKLEERGETEAKAKEQKLKKNEKLIWVPSPTNISLQTMWWGYRMSVNFQTINFMNN